MNNRLLLTTLGILAGEGCGAGLRAMDDPEQKQFEARYAIHFAVKQQLLAQLGAKTEGIQLNGDVVECFDLNYESLEGAVGEILFDAEFREPCEVRQNGIDLGAARGVLVGEAQHDNEKCIRMGKFRIKCN